MIEAGRCPVCQARFRGASLCSRCGADLEPLMVLTVRSWKLRESARNALKLGEFARASHLAAKAEEAQRTAGGEALRLVSKLLAGDSVQASDDC